MVENILHLIPQRPPIVLVDTLVESDAETTVTNFTIPAGHLLAANGFLREPGLIENIAQTAAARAGWNMLANNLAPQTGFIGDISKLEITRLPATGTILKTTVTIIHQVFNVTLIKGIIEDATGLIAQCEMKIVLL